MVFYKVSSPESVAEIIAEKIGARLAGGQTVFWIVTGGSAINIEARASHLLRNYDLSNLSVTLSDERVGPVGHKDSNWQQLIQSGFYLPGARLLPVLDSSGRQKATEKFSKNLEAGFDKSDFSLGIFGIGPDGHTAGILPGSPKMDSREMAIDYDDEEVSVSSPDGVKRGCARTTMTAAAIAKLDEAIVCAFGETKWPWLDKLEENLPGRENPAQALKRAKKLVVYNDYKGEKI